MESALTGEGFRKQTEKRTMNSFKCLFRFSMAAIASFVAYGCADIDDDHDHHRVSTTTTTVEERRVAPTTTEETHVVRY